MSEMLANQYFMSEKYSEALEEYVRLSKVKQNIPLIKWKMIICATLDENFIYAVRLFNTLNTDFFAISTNMRSPNNKILLTNLLNKLKTKNKKNEEFVIVRQLKIAIINMFCDPQLSKQQFINLTKSEYSDIATLFLQKLNKIEQN